MCRKRSGHSLRPIFLTVETLIRNKSQARSCRLRIYLTVPTRRRRAQRQSSCATAFDIVGMSILHTWRFISAKALIEKSTGNILQVYSVCRPITPDAGCLWCNGLIPPGKLQEETETEAERRIQQYVNEPGLIAPSGVTLNATAAAQAANDFLFAVTGLTLPEASTDYLGLLPRERRTRFEMPRRDVEGLECGNGAGSRKARGNGARLPTRALNIQRRK